MWLSQVRSWATMEDATSAGRDEKLTRQISHLFESDEVFDSTSCDDCEGEKYSSCDIVFSSDDEDLKEKVNHHVYQRDDFPAKGLHVDAMAAVNELFQIDNSENQQFTSKIDEDDEWGFRSARAAMGEDDMFDKVIEAVNASLINQSSSKLQECIKNIVDKSSPPDEDVLVTSKSKEDLVDIYLSNSVTISKRVPLFRKMSDIIESPPTVDNNSLFDSNQFTDRRGSLEEFPFERRGSIYRKKHEVEGRSRSMSPVPRRYKPSPAVLRRTPLKLDTEPTNVSESDTNDSTEDEMSEESSVFFKTGLNKVVNLPESSDVVNEFDMFVKRRVIRAPLLERIDSVQVPDPSDESRINEYGTPGSALVESLKKPRRRILRSFSGGSTSEDEIPSVHKQRTKKTSKDKKMLEDNSFFAVREEKTDAEEVALLINETHFSKPYLEPTSDSSRPRSSSIGALTWLNRNKTRRDSSSSLMTHIGDSLVVEQRNLHKKLSNSLLKLSDKDTLNRDVIENYIKPLKLPPKLDKSEVKHENPLFPSNLSEKPLRWRSEGHLNVVPRRVSLVTEPWVGAWDNTVLRLVSNIINF